MFLLSHVITTKLCRFERHLLVLRAVYPEVLDTFFCKEPAKKHSN
jgi:hypothetical protein